MMNKSRNQAVAVSINKFDSSLLQKVRNFGAAAVLASFTLILGACTEDRVADQPVVDPVDTSPEAVTADPPARDATPLVPPISALIGQTVTASVDVRTVISPRVFVVQDELWYGGLPVLVARDDTTPAIRQGEEIQMTGTFRQFVVADVEKLADADLAPEVEVEFKTRPFLYAKAIDIINPDPGQ